MVAEIVLRWEAPEPVTGATQVLAAFRPSAGDAPLPVIRLVGSYSVLNSLEAALGTSDPLELRAALAAYAISRIEGDRDVWDQLERGEADPVLMMIDEGVVAGLGGHLTKRCDRQVKDGQELWCNAAGPDDETATFRIEGRLAAPTSTAICAACDVPDSRLRCSAFAHPSVSAVRAAGGLHERSLDWAICNDGHQDRILGQPQLCVPEDGHDCWHRVVTLGPDDPAVLLDPLALPDTLDRLDDVWRLAFGSHVLAVHSSRDAASLAIGSGTRELFMDRIRGLTEILGDLAVNDSLIPVDTPDDFKKNSLNRVETALRSRLVEDDSVERSVDAIGQLRRVLRLDNALQHPTGQLAVLFSNFGVSYPPGDWEHAWSILRTSTVEALRVIISAVRDVADLESDD